MREKSEAGRARAAAALDRYRRAVWKAEALSEEVRELRTLDQRLGPVLTGMPKAGGRTDRLAGTVERLESRTRQLGQQVEQCLSIQQELGGLFDQLEDTRMGQLLWMRYIRGCGWKEISERMDLTERWVRTLHQRALDRLGRLLETPKDAAEGPPPELEQNAVKRPLSEPPQTAVKRLPPESGQNAPVRGAGA